MRLTLVDRIVELEPGRQIKAIKSLSLAEEYLGDHFPHFPVMPGVMMLEAMYQAAAWLVRATEDFANSMVTISEANNVKYSDFVEPGETLVVSAVLMKQEDGWSRLKCQGEGRRADCGSSSVGLGELLFKRTRRRRSGDRRPHDRPPTREISAALSRGNLRKQIGRAGAARAAYITRLEERAGRNSTSWETVRKCHQNKRSSRRSKPRWSTLWVSKMMR